MLKGGKISSRHYFVTGALLLSINAAAQENPASQKTLTDIFVVTIEDQQGSDVIGYGGRAKIISAEQTGPNVLVRYYSVEPMKTADCPQSDVRAAETLLEGHSLSSLLGAVDICKF